MGRGAAYIFAPLGPDLTPTESAFFREADPWGFILFSRNIDTPDRLRRLTADLRDSLGRDAPILIDQEGGRVQRMRPPHWRDWMPPLDQVPAGERAMYLRGLLIGAELLAHGIDVNCAPSADIAFPETHPFLQNRCYGRDPATVIAMARACADGLMDAGCLPVLKHAPGHGRATADSHKALPRIDAPLAELETADFAAFRALADLPMVMTAHILLPEVDPETPITLSPDGVRLLRDKLGLTGLVMTDDISMGALSGPVEVSAARAISAGCDLVLHCNGDMAEMEAIAGQVDAMTEAASGRSKATLQARRSPGNIDIPALEAEFTKLIEDAAQHA